MEFIPTINSEGVIKPVVIKKYYNQSMYKKIAINKRPR